MDTLMSTSTSQDAVVDTGVEDIQNYANSRATPLAFYERKVAPQRPVRKFDMVGVLRPLFL